MSGSGNWILSDDTMKKYFFLYFFVIIFFSSCEPDQFNLSVTENLANKPGANTSSPISRKLHFKFEAEEKEFFDYAFSFVIDKVKIGDKILYVPSQVSC